MEKLTLLTALIFIATFSFAETITLTSGRVIEGQVIERTEELIKMDTGIGVVTTYYLDEIESIEKNESRDSINLLNQKDGNSINDEGNEIKQYFGKVVDILRFGNSDVKGILEIEKKIKILLNEATFLIPPKSCKKHRIINCEIYRLSQHKHS